MAAKGVLYSGTSGLAMPVPKALYPAEFSDKSRLAYYGVLFNSIEINSSFYKLPKIATVQKWAQSVGDNFKFTFKLSKAITHVKQLQFSTADIRSFLQTINYIGDKKGCILIQFPPSVKTDAMAQVKSLLQEIHQLDNTWKVVVEFRDKTWYSEETYQLLQAFGASMVNHDLPASATPISSVNGSFIYLRFHGPGGRYRGSYTNDFLQEYANHIHQWMNDGKDVYVYFNNTMGDAAKNLQTLNELTLKNS